MLPLELSQYRLAKALNVPALRISQIVRGRRAITADTALRLARYFGTTPQLWTNWQSNYELELAKRELEDEINKTVLISDYAMALAETA